MTGASRPLYDSLEGSHNQRRKRSWTDLAAGSRETTTSVGTHATEWQGLPPSRSDETKARTDVWDKIKQQRDQLQAGAVEVDPWLNKVAEGASPATQKKTVAELERHCGQRWATRNASAAGPTSEQYGDGGQEVRGDEVRGAGRSRGAAMQIRTIQEDTSGRFLSPQQQREKNARHGGKNDANDERERVELEDDPYDKLAASRATPLGGQNDARIGAGNRRLPRVQTSRECARERSNTRMFVRSV